MHCIVKGTNSYRQLMKLKKPRDGKGYQHTYLALLFTFGSMAKAKAFHVQCGTSSKKENVQRELQCTSVS